jgi:cleavage and polyadenylation specificity factor subunit 1
VEPVKDMFNDLLQQGIIQASESSYASPLVLVAKKDGNIRPCVDYRRLNAQTSPDSYPLPRIDDILSQVHGQWFSTMDLKNGYYQIPVAPEDVPKTAVTTPFGLFEYVRMPFGLRNAAPTFQRFLDFILRGLSGVFVYIDDILVVTDTLSAHLSRLEDVFMRLSAAGLRINASKSHWCLKEVQYLGYQLTPTGYAPASSRITAITNFPPPTSEQQLRRVLGMLNFYRSHMPNYAIKAAPLYALLNGDFAWSNALDQCLELLKGDLVQATNLRPPQHDKPFTIYTDASNIAVGASIMQDNAPVAFYSASLSPTEQRYSAFDKEALAIVKAVKAYRHWLLGNTVHVHTDHRPLLSFLSMKNPSARQANWSTYLSEYDIQVHHISGVKNTAADCLSRPPEGGRPPDLANVASVKATYDQSHPWYRTLKSFSPPPVSAPLRQIEGLWFECSQKRPRLFVPEDLRRTAFDSVHSTCHPGAKRSASLVAERFFWPNMRKDAKTWADSCLTCQASKVTRHQQHPTWTISAEERFKTVHIDIVGPLPTSSLGHSYVLTMVDKFSRWPEAVPINNISAESCAETFLATWVARFGVPQTIVSDQGRQFESALFNALLNRLGIRHVRTTPYHPQSNGSVERFHRTLKNSLRCVVGDHPQEWERFLPVVLLGLRTSVCAATEVPPCKLILGSELALPADFLLPSSLSSSSLPSRAEFSSRLDRQLEYFQRLALSHQPRESRPPVQAAPAWIWLRKDEACLPSLSRPYRGPFKVISQSGPVIKVRGPDGKAKQVNIDRTKPVTCFFPEDQEEGAEESDSEDRAYPIADTSPSPSTPEAHLTVPAQPTPQQPQQHVQVSSRGRILRPSRRYGYTT